MLSKSTHNTPVLVYVVEKSHKSLLNRAETFAGQVLFSYFGLLMVAAFVEAFVDEMQKSEEES